MWRSRELSSYACLLRLPSQCFLLSHRTLGGRPASMPLIAWNRAQTLWDLSSCAWEGGRVRQPRYLAPQHRLGRRPFGARRRRSQSEVLPVELRRIRAFTPTRQQCHAPCVRPRAIESEQSQCSRLRDDWPARTAGRAGNDEIRHNEGGPPPAAELCRIKIDAYAYRICAKRW
jgi:hypothetical protein